MLKVDNIIPLWRVVIPNMVSESCPKLSHDNRILKYRTKIMSLDQGEAVRELHTWYQSHALNLAMTIESSNIEQRL